MEDFDDDLTNFFIDPIGDTVFATDYFNVGVMPMWDAHRAYKAGDMQGALNCLSAMTRCDWKIACTEWLLRRQK